MSQTQLHKNLTGQYGFSVDSDRQQTLANLGFGNTANAASQAVAKVAGVNADGSLFAGTLATTVTDSATPTIDWSLGSTFVLNANGTSFATQAVAMSNIVASKTITLKWTTTSAVPTVTWPGTVTWTGGATPVVPPVGSSAVYRFTATSLSVGGVIGEVVPAANSGVQAVTAASTTNLDWSLGNTFSIPVNSGTVAALTFTFSNTTQKTINVFIPVTGTPTITWPTMKWTTGSPPSVPATTKVGWYRISLVGTQLYGETVNLAVA